MMSSPETDSDDVFVLKIETGNLEEGGISTYSVYVILCYRGKFMTHNRHLLK